MTGLNEVDVWPNPLLPQQVFPPPQAYPRPDVSRMVAGFKLLAEHMAEHLVPAIEEMGRQAASLSESIAKWQNAYDTAREEDPLRRAIPKPSTTPPMWAVRPEARRRRHHG